MIPKKIYVYSTDQKVRTNLKRNLRDKVLFFRSPSEMFSTKFKRNTLLIVDVEDAMNEDFLYYLNDDDMKCDMMIIFNENYEENIVLKQCRKIPHVVKILSRPAGWIKKTLREVYEEEYV